MEDTEKRKEFNWSNAPKAACIKILTVGDSFAVLVFRQPDGTWSAEPAMQPIGNLKSLSEAMTVAEAIARQWKAGLQ